MLTKKLQIFTRIYNQFDPSFSLICYYSFIFGLLQISTGLLVFGFIANKYQWRAIRLLLTICNIQSAIRRVIPKLILNYLRLPTFKHLTLSIGCKISLVAKKMKSCEYLAWLTSRYFAFLVSYLYCCWTLIIIKF